jgi:DNA-binding NarL/FixJ family response regulator
VKVLIVDDHALVRDAVSLLLSTLEQQFVPLTAATCEEAFAVLDDEKDIGLVLMDLNLPGMSGTDGIDIMRTKYPDLPIVALSGTEDRSLILDSIRRGAMGFIPKTYSGERLIDTLRYILVHKGIFLPAELFLEASSTLRPSALSELPPASSPRAGQVTPADLGLTARQAAVLYLVLQGKTNKAIARELNIEGTTVRTHVTAVLRALNVTTRTEAVIVANRMKLVFPEAS